MPKQDLRPVFLNLFKIHFPVTAILSIIHRIMGVVMVIGLPFLIYLMGLSLESEAGFKLAQELLADPFVLVLSVGFVWALAHHLLAGIRYLFLDFEIGVNKYQSRLSAYVVNISAALLTLIYIWSLL